MVICLLRTLIIFSDTSHHLLSIHLAKAKFLTHIVSLNHHYLTGRTVVSPLFTWDPHRLQVVCSGLHIQKVARPGLADTSGIPHHPCQ